MVVSWFDSWAAMGDEMFSGSIVAVAARVAGDA